MTGRRAARQAAAVAALLAAGVASLATSQPYAEVDNASQSTRLVLDAEHRFASQEFVVTVPAEAAVGLGQSSALFRLDRVSATDASGRPVVPGEALRLRVVAVSAESERGAAPSRSPGPWSTPAADQWTVDADNYGAAELPIDCRPPGPCTRAFRLLVTLTSQADRAEIAWHVETELSWAGSAYPSGVATRIRVDEPSLAADAPAQLDVATEPESIILAADQPAAARIVELRMAAPSAGATGLPSATLEAVAVADAPGSTSRPSAVTDIYPIDGSAPASLTPLPPNADPFAGCTPGLACKRRFLVTMSWTRGDERSYTWQLVLHRLDVGRAVSEGAGAVSLVTVGGIESVGPPSHLHFEGDATWGGDASQVVTIPLRVRFVPSPSPSGTGPKATGQGGFDVSALASLLPIPGSMGYAFRYAGSPPSHAGLAVSVGLAPPGSLYSQQLATVSPPGGGTSNPFLSCRPGTDCPVIALNGYYQIIGNGPDEAIGVHWSLDVDVYSYPGLRLSLEQASPLLSSPPPTSPPPASASVPAS